MCGRFELHASASELAEYFELQQQLPRWLAMKPRYNIAPTQTVLAIRLNRDKQRHLSWLRWGLVPHWASDPKIGARLINARSETAGEKPAFREAYRRRRCLVPASGFYEWAPKPATPSSKQGKQPYYVHRADGHPMAFAGLWERWGEGEQRFDSCTILTTDAAPSLAPIHHRMPVILEPASFSTWLNPDADEAGLEALCAPCPDATVAFYPVSDVVNRAENDVPECVNRLVEPQGTLL